MNNKGFTTVEVLVCFVIISIVMMSMFSTISAFNEKRIQESYRAKVYEFKNEITNMIQEDIVRRGLLFVKLSESGSPGTVAGKKYIVEFTFGDGTQKKLEVYQRYTKTSYRASGTTEADDSFYINYGFPNDMIQYELPDLGSTSGVYQNGVFELANTRGKCYDSSNQEVNCAVAQDFQINNVLIYITNEADLNDPSHVLNIYIGFYHPNLGTKYAIDIVAPINYQTSAAGQNSFNTTNSNSNSDSAVYYP